MLCKVSPGNDKIGSIPNVSLLPVVTCDCRFPCAKRHQCYAWRFSKRPHTQAAWKHNTQNVKKDIKKFFFNLYLQLSAEEPRRFRWHVGGDCPSLEYVREVFNLAELLPSIRFLIYTKRYAWFNKVVGERDIPRNLSIKLSAWPGYKVPNPHNLPVAWMLDKRNPDDRIPTKGFYCPGNCRTCNVCWKKRNDVVFHKH